MGFDQAVFAFSFLARLFANVEGTRNGTGSKSIVMNNVIIVDMVLPLGTD
jgi:hypothetical protein